MTLDRWAVYLGFLRPKSGLPDTVRFCRVVLEAEEVEQRLVPSPMDEQSRAAYAGFPDVDALRRHQGGRDER